MDFSTKILLWLALAIVFACLMGSLNVPALYRLNEHGIPAEALVVKTTPAIHNTFQYAYTVAGASYEGTGQISDVPNAEVGAKVEIYYLANSPNVSRAGNIRAKLINELVSVGMVALIPPLLIVWRISAALRKRQQKK
jgi:hypothetical protein